jgi:hypothetical protein
MALLYSYQARGIAHHVVIRDIVGNVITPQAGDIVRIRISSCGVDYLTVSSAAASTNGSTIETGETNQIKLKAADLAILNPGTYSYVVDYNDSADNEWKEVEKSIIHVEIA